MSNKIQKKQQRRKHQQGFTLIEIRIVLAIMGVLFSFVGVNVIEKFKESKVQAAKIQIAALEQGLQSYYLSHNNYPHTSQGLEALVSKPSVGKVPPNWTGGHLKKKEVPLDPFGNPYRYVCDDYQDYAIYSNGPDGQPDTEDDISSEK